MKMSITENQEKLNNLYDKKQDLVDEQQRLELSIVRMQKEIEKARESLKAISDRRGLTGKLPMCEAEISYLEHQIKYSQHPKPVWLESEFNYRQDYVIEKITKKRIYLTNPESPGTSDYLNKREAKEEYIDLRATLKVWRKFQKQ